VLLLGTPVLWWSFLPALAGLTWFGISRRDWRAGAIGLGAAAGIIPWFWYEIQNRTMFYFYALPALPFLILAVVYVLGAIIGPAPARSGPLSDRRLFGTIFAAAYVALVALCFAYFYPIYTGKVITYAEWTARMWLGGRWI
jgi:dolichyl-phosphate-mannose--protein O-mannosyl transferase